MKNGNLCYPFVLLLLMFSFSNAALHKGPFACTDIEKILYKLFSFTRTETGLDNLERKDIKLLKELISAELIHCYPDQVRTDTGHNEYEITQDQLEEVVYNTILLFIKNSVRKSILNTGIPLEDAYTFDKDGKNVLEQKIDEFYEYFEKNFKDIAEKNTGLFNSPSGTYASFIGASLRRRAIIVFFQNSEPERVFSLLNLREL